MYTDSCFPVLFFFFLALTALSAVVGPPTEVIERMGDKVHARQIARRCNIPTIPGTDGPLYDIQDAHDFIKQSVSSSMSILNMPPSEFFLMSFVGMDTQLLLKQASVVGPRPTLLLVLMELSQYRRRPRHACRA
jgi:hypothetical protein